MGVDTAQREQTEPLDPASLREGVHVDLTPHDVWVLGQLIEADTASLPREMQEAILNGYRILKATGYEPPPTGNPPNVDLTAPTDEASLNPEPAMQPQSPTETVVREVVIAEVTAAEPRNDEPPAPAANLPAHEPVVPVLERVADAVEELTEQVSNDESSSSSPEPEQEPVSTVAPSPRVLFDVILITVTVLVAALFVTASAFLRDPVFALLALGLVAAGAWLTVPWMRDNAKEDAL